MRMILTLITRRKRVVYVVLSWVILIITDGQFEAIRYEELTRELPI
jgi:hypothetical protein